ncbi:sterol desaturase family protein [Frateuria terrea]|uniref:Sterol desaturase/sphingolipid hydroxylase, fatty acid hydroxylase superfamily n=1 Tax=Frateuria terrea TaxID=529704 RepID=A0A1H6X8D6_9GAMM|nr:sterol desaturase family protein [Frateuria terrea]SEJ25481.1 Sterol desaturase/sphingolipid hydroxylase, fatty acid hydroxylase superfamily [Frateuria terrea]SFP59949.1 Sterol desaturase/sphingolipid hydroxylase, fatty acid hydroxylase superfamily [Frateuria terrea]
MHTQEQIISWATPVFFVLIGLELLVARWRGRAAYRTGDAISSIGLGVISQVVGVFAKLLSIGIYAWVAAHAALWKLPADHLAVWVIALLAYDFLYYWLHRAGHEVNILWAAHVVHHQSEHYNLSTALRQTGSGVLLGWLFYLPMALAGIPVEVFVPVALVDLLYQFWVHTEQVGRLGWFDRVFCSPSNHRVHHAVNERYLDRNYGGILILWDRLFGTFVEEDDADRPVYGTRAPLRSWNPLWANAEVYWAAAKDAWHARHWRDKALVWLKPPGWRPADVAARFPKPAFDMRRERFDPPMSHALIAYSLLQFALLLAMTTQFLGLSARASLPALLGYAAYLVGSLTVLGALMEGRRGARWAEAVRVLGTALLPWLTGRWFGIAQLDPRMAFGLLLAFGLAALALPWLGNARGAELAPVSFQTRDPR